MKGRILLLLPRPLMQARLGVPKPNLSCPPCLIPFMMPREGWEAARPASVERARGPQGEPYHQIRLVQLQIKVILTEQRNIRGYTRNHGKFHWKPAEVPPGIIRSSTRNHQRFHKEQSEIPPGTSRGFYQEPFRGSTRNHQRFY